MSVPVGDVDFGEQNIIYVTMDKDNKNVVEWTDPSVEELLKLLKQNLLEFENGKFRTKKQLYEHLSIALKAKNFNYTGPQIENKWKSLKRSYLSRYERGIIDGPRRRYSHAKGTFEGDVEEILQIERPDFKKEFEAFNSVNLNVPPGYGRSSSRRSERNRKRKVVSSEDEEEEEEEEEQEKYTKPDEELVQYVLKQESPSQSPKNDMFTDIQYAEDNHNGPDVLVRELRDIKKVIQESIDINTEVLKNHNQTHEQVLFFLDGFEKREEEILEIKKQKLDKQDELIQQVKIQNSLIAKLIQKLGEKK